MRIRGLELSASNPIVQRGRRIWRLNESPKAKDLIYHAYCNEASLNKYPQKKGLEKASGLVNTWRCWEDGTPREGMEAAPPPFPTPGFMHLFHLAVIPILLLLLLLIQESCKSTVFLSSVSPSSKLTEPEEGVWGPPIYSWSVRNLNGKLHV